MHLCVCVCVRACVYVFYEQIERPDFHAREDGKDNTYDTEVRPVNVQQDSRQEAASNDILGKNHRGLNQTEKKTGMYLVREMY